MNVTYRSKSEMIIAAQKSDKENFLVKSDYFNADMKPKNLQMGIQLNKKFVFNFNLSNNALCIVICYCLQLYIF